jgi:hypothetical protein
VAKKASDANKRKIEHYTHRKKTRVNNPPVGLVTLTQTATLERRPTPSTLTSIPLWRAGSSSPAPSHIWPPAGCAGSRHVGLWRQA